MYKVRTTLGRLRFYTHFFFSGASGSGKTNLLDFIIRNQSECFNFEAYSKEKKSSSSSSSPRRKGFDRISKYIYRT